MDKIQISHKTIIFTVFFLIFLALLYQLREIILLLFVSVIFTSALSPIVAKLERFKIPRSVSIFVIYALFLALIVTSLVLIIPSIINQIAAFFKYFPEFVNGSLNKWGFLTSDIQLKDYSAELARLPANLLRIVISTFSNLVKIFAFGVITFYLLMERKNLKKHLKVIFSKDGEARAEKIVIKFEKKLGGWVRGEIFLMAIVGLMSYIGLKLLDIDFALPLALIAGLLELVPNIGPTVSMIPALIVGFAASPTVGLAVAALYFLIQQIENNLIVPKVMQKAIGLHPLVTLIALMAGLKLGGVGGSLLAIPTLLSLQIIIGEVYFSYANSSLEKTAKRLGDL